MKGKEWTVQKVALGKLHFIYRNIKLDLYFTPYKNINARSNKNLNVKSKNPKTLESCIYINNIFSFVSLQCVLA